MMHASDYLERAALRIPDSVAYLADGEALTCAETDRLARRIGAAVAGAVPPGRVVAVLGERGVRTPAMFFGVLYAGCCLTPLSPEVPPSRLREMLETVKAEVIVTDGHYESLLGQLGFTGPVVRLADAGDLPYDDADLRRRRAEVSGSDPCLVLFTSGSSGKPKGVVLPHRAIIDAIDVYARVFSIGPRDILGAQSPLDYVAAIRDIFLPPATGCKTVMIPRRLFSTPAPLFAFLNLYRITTLFWAAPALSLCAELGVFSSCRLESVEKVIFTGSVLPIRHLRIWMENLPGAYYANHYGPTEITGSCIYYEVKGPADPALEKNSLPIGIPFPNVRIYLLDDDGREVPEGELGEICVAGARLALGYWGAPALTGQAFVRHMDNGLVHMLYRTGDVGRRDAQGTFTFHGRRDSQIKHMGHRIELGEIESICVSLPMVARCVCLYDGKQIWLFYEGEDDARGLSLFLRERLPSHMIPRKIR
ncbi:MAG: AMP-binding protein, partial [Oscillospiraceae bacterium]|nr:AMP-binding protein [Oscillospiraceae bacterium]